MAEPTQTAQQVFDTASKLLSEGKFQDAADNFQAILNKGATSSDLEANLGHALTEGGQHGPGVLHLMNAVALDRAELRYRDDLRMAQSKVESGLGVPMSHPVEWGNRIGSYLRPGDSLSIASMLVLAWLIVWMFRLPLKKSQQFLFAFLIAAFIAGAGFARYGQSVSIVLSPAELRAGPLSSSELIQSLPSGTRLRVIRRSGEFAEVERVNSFRGWVLSSNLAKSPY